MKTLTTLLAAVMLSIPVYAIGSTGSANLMTLSGADHGCECGDNCQCTKCKCGGCKCNK